MDVIRVSTITGQPFVDHYGYDIVDVIFVFDEMPPRFGGREIVDFEWPGGRGGRASKALLFMTAVAGFGDEEIHTRGDATIRGELIDSPASERTARSPAGDELESKRVVPATRRGSEGRAVVAPRRSPSGSRPLAHEGRLLERQRPRGFSISHDGGRPARWTSGAPSVSSTTHCSTGWRTAPPTRSPVRPSREIAVGRGSIAASSTGRCANNAARDDDPVACRHRFTVLPRKSLSCRPGGTAPTMTRTRGSRRVVWRLLWKGRVVPFGTSRVRRPPKNGLSPYTCSSGSGRPKPDAGRRGRPVHHFGRGTRFVRPGRPSGYEALLI